MIVAWAPVTDEPTAVSRWLVERNASMLETEPGCVVALLAPDVNTREAFEQAVVAPEVVGLVAGGHGDRYRLYGGNAQVALDFGNAHIMRGRWAHLIACRCGEGSGLAERLVVDGATIVAAYEAPVHVGFEPGALAPKTLALLETLVTATTRALAQGWRFVANDSEKPSPHGLREASDAFLEHLLDLLDDDPDNEDFAGLNLLAQMLVARLCVYQSQD